MDYPKMWRLRLEVKEAGSSVVFVQLFPQEYISTKLENFRVGLLTRRGI